jgi:hypothetical protein
MNKKLIYVILFIYTVLCIFTLFFFDGTGDAGDSINHYLYAKYAFIHPELFFDHWAKPLFVLLSSPFAQFGFIGMKIFNVSVSLLSIFFTYKAANELKLKNSILVLVIMMFAPLQFILTFSGLTEPLFALFISMSLYFAVKKNYVLCAILISFLPFVRSEGLIMMGIFALFFALKKQWKAIPLLLIGHIIYSFAGYFIHHDLLWVFTKIPYQQLSSNYGSGTMFHFVEQLMYVVGVPVYILFWLGISAIIFKSIKRTSSLEEQILVYLGFAFFFIAHALFWYLGIFHSLGLIRVLLSVMPLIGIIALQGFNFLTEDLIGKKMIAKRITGGLLILYILIFPFTHNHAAINWKTDMMLNGDQQSAIRVSEFIKNTSLKNPRILFAHPYLAELLEIDPFADQKASHLNPDHIREMKPSDLIVWENSFASFEMNIQTEDLGRDTSLVKIYDLYGENKGREIHYTVYQKK